MFTTTGYMLGALSAMALLGNCERGAVATPPPPPAAPELAKVVMQNMQFSPATIEIPKGGTVEWTNEDLIPHTATSPAFGDSGALASGQSWRHIFEETGSFPYVCTFHPTMKATVIVK